MNNKTKDFNGHPRFYEILDLLAELHDRKNHDYSNDGDPMSNLRQCEDMGIPAWQGVVVRLTDKMDRLKTYAKKGQFKVKGEGIKDTFEDMAVYAILGLILFEEDETKEKA